MTASATACDAAFSRKSGVGPPSGNDSCVWKQRSQSLRQELKYPSRVALLTEAEIKSRIKYFESHHEQASTLVVLTEGSRVSCLVSARSVPVIISRKC